MTVIPLGRALLRGSSDLPGSCGAPSRHARAEARSSPIWSCSVWGLPCRRHCWRRGALLPHLFTLTRDRSHRRYVLCGTFRKRPLTAAPRTLSGTPLCGVRTFLCELAPTATVRPSS